jgi:NAD(P)H-hydrate epimerase
MDRIHFQTENGLLIPAVTEDEMREIDRIAVEDFQLGILQMMENAGRNLALLAINQLGVDPEPVSILAGRGGNGGGGLCCARHLHNRGYDVRIFLSGSPDTLRGAAKTQMTILKSAGAQISIPSEAEEALTNSGLILDALIGYSLSGPPSGETERLIQLANASSTPILSLDLPSGMDATLGTTPGIFSGSKSTLTLALPKTGLRDYTGSLFLADIGIPPELYRQLGIEAPAFPPSDFILPIHAM